jgi:DUF4097 and DUF4098 domain-containing protein YvlB
MLKPWSKVAALLLVITPAVLAQQGRVFGEEGNWTQEITGNLSGAKNLRVKVECGSVHVAGGSQQGINYVIRNHSGTTNEDKARREFEGYKISTYVRGDTAWIVAEWDGGRPRRFSGDFMINVPREMDEVKIETEGGDVETVGVAGGVNAESGGGSIRLDDIGGGINAETGGGSIDVGKAAAEVNLQTGGGAIRVSSVKGNVHAESGGGSLTVQSVEQDAELQTGGGSIHLDRCGGRLKATTGGGSIDLGDIGGPAEIETGGGSIRLNSAKGFVRASTGGGTIELNGVPAARAETGAGGIVVKFVAATNEQSSSSLETSAGDITVYFAANVHLNVRASIDIANGHNIHSDFPEIKVTTEGGNYGPKTVTAEGKLNGGGPVLKVATETGDISFRRSGR